MQTRAPILEPPAQEKLAGLTRAAIMRAVLRQGPPEGAEVARLCREEPLLAHPMGAFVTIYVEAQLRGCLGEIEPEDSLVQVVLRCARRVPLNDYRFNPVRPEELPLLTFKISILSVPEPVEELDQIQLGVHGLIARHDGHVGLLLPEVPTEYGWDLTTFLGQLRRKAGIPAVVPDGAIRFLRFTSQVIDGKDFALGD